MAPTGGPPMSSHPQKGAFGDAVKILDDSLQHFAEIINQQMGRCVSNTPPGAGAAGGLGAALMAFFDVKPQSGIDIVLDYSRFEKHLQDVNLVITGEGRIDQQTMMGKTPPLGVAKRAKQFNIPVIGLAGSIDTAAVKSLNGYIDAVFSITQGPASLEFAKCKADEWLRITAEQIMRCIRVSKE